MSAWISSISLKLSSQNKKSIEFGEQRCRRPVYHNENRLSILRKTPPIIDNMHSSSGVEPGSGFIGEQDFGSSDKLNCDLNRSTAIEVLKMTACTHRNSLD